MMTLLSILLLGFFLGMRHATDADHVVSVSNFITRQGSVRGAIGVGCVWGLGHSLAIVLGGGSIVLFGLAIPPRLGLPFEFGIAMMLIVIGLMNLGGFVHALRFHRHPGDGKMPGVLRPLTVGMVHGLAGSAAMALLVVPLIHNSAWAMAYLLIFGVGSIVGMMAITAAIAFPLAPFVRKSQAAGHRLATVAGTMSVAFGLFLVYKIGFVDGLFLS